MNKENKKDEIKISKLSLFQSLTLILGVLLIISILTNGFSSTNSEIEIKTETIAVQNENVRPSNQEQEQPSINLNNAAFKGNENAEITIVEYSSFSCGFCDRARGTIDQILEEYPNQVKIVYKHFDRGGTDSQTGQASECAGDQDKFWEMHDMIFDRGSSGDYYVYAREIGLDENDFKECFDSGKYASRVNEHSQEGRSLGVTGTPTFFINGQKLVGAQPFQAFKNVIDPMLA